MKRNNERGQSMVITVVFMVVLLGFAALVIDVGSWYRAHRAAQSTADAAALAGAQVLPDTQNATALAQQYVNKNSDGGGPGTGGTTPQITITQQGYEPDTITVKVTRPAPGFFAKVFGSAFGSVNVSRTATARAYNVYGVQNEVGPGAFHIINIDGSRGGTSSATLGQWVETGLDAYMPLAWYYSDPGSKFNSGNVRQALDYRIGTDLLFPVYRHVRAQGSGFEYEVIGWVGFHLTGYSIGGKGKLMGSFTRIIWDGIQSDSSTPDDFGARSISLVD